MWRKIHESLSANGQILTRKFSTPNPDGSVTTDVETWQRLSGSGGLVGQWKRRNEKSSDPGLMTIRLNDHSIRVSDSGTGQNGYEVKLDGTPAPVSDMPKGFTIAFRQQGPTKLTYEFKLNGKTMLIGVETLSADGRQLTEEKWMPGKEADKQTLVYDKLDTANSER